MPLTLFVLLLLLLLLLWVLTTTQLSRVIDSSAVQSHFLHAGSLFQFFRPFTPEKLFYTDSSYSHSFSHAASNIVPPHTISLCLWSWHFHTFNNTFFIFTFCLPPTLSISLYNFYYRVPITPAYLHAVWPDWSILESFWLQTLRQKFPKYLMTFGLFWKQNF